MNTVSLEELKSGMICMDFFNSKEVYAQKYFDTMRKAQNFCKKYNYIVVEKLPENIDSMSILYQN